MYVTANAHGTMIYITFIVPTTVGTAHSRYVYTVRTYKYFLSINLKRARTYFSIYLC